MIHSFGVTFRSVPMTRFRSVGLPVFVAAVMITGAAFAQDRGGGFLDKLFGGSDRYSDPGRAPGEEVQGQPGAAMRGTQSDSGARVERLEATIRQLTGEIEELQH